MTDRDGTTLTWTSDNKPAQISAAGHTRQFSYAPSRARFRQVATEGGQSTETLYIAGGLYERVSGPHGTEHRHYIVAAGETVAVHLRRSDYNHETRYLHADHLGSVAAITDESGGLLARLSFDAFGARRGGDWSADPPSGADEQVIASTTARGYTFHEMLDGIDLIHW